MNLSARICSLLINKCWHLFERNCINRQIQYTGESERKDVAKKKKKKEEGEIKRREKDLVKKKLRISWTNRGRRYTIPK